MYKAHDAPENQKPLTTSLVALFLKRRVPHARIHTKGLKRETKCHKRWGLYGYVEDNMIYQPEF